MKRKIIYSALAFTLLSGTNVIAAEDLSTMFSEGKTSGQIRMFYIDRDYSGSVSTHRNATAIGGHLKYETADFHGLSFGTAFYTTNGVFLRSDNTSAKVDPSLLGPDNESYSMVGELYGQYKIGNTLAKAGRQKLDTPMAGSDDARMTPNLFEAYLVVNKDIPDTTLLAGHITQFAQGSFGRVYDASGAGGNNILSVTSGYSHKDSRDNAGTFKNAGTYAIGKSTAGVSVVSATYTGVENLKVQLWDYYAYDLANIVYGDLNFSWDCLITDIIKPKIGIQAIKQNSVGDKYAGKIDSLYVAGQFGFSIDNFNLNFAYSQTGKNNANDGALKNAIVTPWGGMPAYTQGMVTRHQFLAGTKAAKIAGGYNFKDLGTNLSLSAFYAEFDMDEHSGYGLSRTASEAGFDAIYNPETVKNLQLRLRGNFPRDYAKSAAGSTGWDEYRLIANYNF